MQHMSCMEAVLMEEAQAQPEEVGHKTPTDICIEHDEDVDIIEYFCY